MSKSSKIILGVVVVLIVIIGAMSLRNNETVVTLDEQGPIKIGFVGPLTGDAASIGESAQAAVALAEEEINASGGIAGRNLEVIYEDGGCDGTVASNAANKLMNIDNVPVILGGACSPETLSFSSAAEEKGTVVLSYCSSAPNITEAGDYIFRDYPSDLYQGSFSAEYIFNTLEKKKVAILYVNNDWGIGIKDVFKKNYSEMGGEILIEEGYEKSSTDLRTQLTKIKNSNPELVYFLGFTESSIAGLKQAKEINLDVPLFGGDAWDDPTIFTEAGEAADGIMYTVVYAPLNDDFKAKMLEKTGSSDITVCVPQAYDGLYVLKQVIEKVGTNPEDIKNELYNTEYTGGVSSAKIDFDENGDLIGASYLVKVVQDGASSEKVD